MNPQIRHYKKLHDKTVKALDYRAIERAVMADIHRPCLYNVAGLCSHPRCLEAHFETLKARESLKAIGK